MPYTTFPVNIIGPSGQSRSRSYSNQVTRNLYFDFQAGAESPVCMNVWPGSKLFGNGSGDQNDRGIYVFGTDLFKVTESGLYQVSSAGAETFIGAIDGSGRVGFADNENNFVITTGDLRVAMLNNQAIYAGGTGSGYVYTASGGLQKIVDPDFGVTGDQWQVSQPDSPASIDPLNTANAESNGDPLQAPYSFNEFLYLFGTKTTEVWENTGSGNPPFSKVIGAKIDIGLHAKDSTAQTPNFLYFLGSDRSIYRIAGFQEQKISTNAISHQLNKVETASKAIGSVINFDNQNFYVLTIPEINKTYAFSEEANEWTEVSSGLNGGRWQANSYEFAYNKRIIALNNSDRLLELDLDLYEENGEEFIKQRDTAKINSSNTFKAKTAKRLVMSRFQLEIETGVGLVSGQGQVPQVMFSASLDGSKTFTNESWVGIGRNGAGIIKVEWYQMLSFYEAQFRIRFSDPVFTSIRGASIDLKLGGR